MKWRIFGSLVQEHGFRHSQNAGSWNCYSMFITSEREISSIFSWVWLMRFVLSTFARHSFRYVLHMTLCRTLEDSSSIWVANKFSIHPYGKINFNWYEIEWVIPETVKIGSTKIEIYWRMLSNWFCQVIIFNVTYPIAIF